MGRELCDGSCREGGGWCACTSANQIILRYTDSVHRSEEQLRSSPLKLARRVPGDQNRQICRLQDLRHHHLTSQKEALALLECLLGTMAQFTVKLAIILPGLASTSMLIQSLDLIKSRTFQRTSSLSVNHPATLFYEANVVQLFFDTNLETSSLFMHAISNALQFPIPTGQYSYLVGWVSAKFVQMPSNSLINTGSQLRRKNSLLGCEYTLQYLVEP